MEDTRAKLVPYLEHTPQRGGPAHRIVLHRSPFTIGRSQEADHTLYSRDVSTLHAEIVQVGDGYVLRDLGSTNGTFVNGQRTTQHWLTAGDIVHIAEQEMRFGLQALEERVFEPTLASPDDRQQRLIRESNDLMRVLATRAVTAFFQPIVQLSDAARIGYETLGRVTLQDPVYSVGEMLRIAADRGEGVRISQLFRQASLELLPRLPERPVSVFFNLHPAEMGDLGRLEAGFAEIAGSLGSEQKAILEVHEGAVTDPGAMRSIRERLDAAGIGLAYDDFGAGQSRLMELVEVPPDVLKLDMALVRDIDQSAKRQDLVGALISVVRDMGIRVLAEGVETGEEATVCAQLGCELGQGYYFGKPQPIG